MDWHEDLQAACVGRDSILRSARGETDTGAKYRCKCSGSIHLPESYRLSAVQCLFAELSTSPKPRPSVIYAARARASD